MNLHEAAKNGDIRRINELLDQGVDVNLKNITGSTALMVALNSDLY